jgi:hypothetical protein
MELRNTLVVATQPLIIQTPDMLQLCHKSQKPPPISGGRFGDHIFFYGGCQALSVEKQRAEKNGAPTPFNNRGFKSDAPYLLVPLRGEGGSCSNSICHSFRFLLVRDFHIVGLDRRKNRAPGSISSALQAFSG